MEDADKKIRPIRSYILRQGRLTKYQSMAIEKFADEFIIPVSDEYIDWNAIFSANNKEKFIEIGFGMGDTTAEIAMNMPEKNFVGIEVHSPGVGNLINKKLVTDI